MDFGSFCYVSHTMGWTFVIVFHPFFLIFVRYVNTELQSDDDRNIQHLSLFCMFSLCLTVVIDLSLGTFSADSCPFFMCGGYLLSVALYT